MKATLLQKSSPECFKLKLKLFNFSLLTFWKPTSEQNDSFGFTLIVQTERFMVLKMVRKASINNQGKATYDRRCTGNRASYLDKKKLKS